MAPALLRRAAACAISFTPGGADADSAFPGPAAWDGRARLGAAIYAVLFLLALAGIALLLRRNSGEEGRS